MFKLVFAGALALAAVPALAQTADNAFNGPFVGVQAGWQQDKLNVDVNNIDFSAKSDGFAYGGQIGYDFRAGTSVVVGLEAALTGRSGDASIAGFDISTGRTINVTGRLGYLVDPQGLLYARGGYSNARFSADDGFDGGSINRDGYTIGAGYERMLGTNVSARLEYNYSNFGSENAVDDFNNQAEVEFDRHAITAGLNFRF